MLKCIIWDLDNTIWDGVLLEDNQVKLKEKSIELIQKAYDRGIIQTVSSKNDYNMAMDQLIKFNLDKFLLHPLISFNRKSDSIKKFIQDMHFRANDVLFVDDMDIELNEVKFLIPDIEVKNINEFDEINELISNNKILSMDNALNRIQAYKTEEKRLLDKDNYQDVFDFLMQSGFTIHIEKANKADLPRISELLERTHQLNTSGMFYSENEILNMMEDDTWELIIADVKDKYGEYGKSALILAKKEKNIFTIKVLIISCRLLGKGITQYMLQYAFEFAKTNHYDKLCVDYVKNKHNKPMQILLQMNGFHKIHVKENQFQFWLDTKLNVSPITKSTWIKAI